MNNITLPPETIALVIVLTAWFLYAFWYLLGILPIVAKILALALKGKEWNVRATLAFFLILHLAHTFVLVDSSNLVCFTWILLCLIYASRSAWNSPQLRPLVLKQQNNPGPKYDYYPFVYISLTLGPLVS